MVDLRVVVALAVAVAITVLLRALPFVLKDRLAGSDLLDDVGRWLPLGVMAVLSVHLLAGADLGRGYAIPEAAGAVVTVGLHLWRRNLLLSLLGGTGTYLVLVNLVWAG